MLCRMLLVAVSQVAVLVCVGVSVHRKRAAWRAWAFLAIIVLLSAGLVAHSRHRSVRCRDRKRSSLSHRLAWLVPLTLCAAFAREPILTPTVPDRDARLPVPSSRALTPVVASATLIAYAGGSVATAAQLQRDWPGSQSRWWGQTPS